MIVFVLLFIGYVMGASTGLGIMYLHLRKLEKQNRIAPPPYYLEEGVNV